MKYVVAGMVALFAFVFTMDIDAGGQEKPKYTISEVMKEAHGKGGLLKKVQSGDASKEDREKLAELYKALAENAPKKGDAEEWKKATAPLVKAADAAVKDAAEGKKVKANCMVCHKTFK